MLYPHTPTLPPTPPLHLPSPNPYPFPTAHPSPTPPLPHTLPILSPLHYHLMPQTLTLPLQPLYLPSPTPPYTPYPLPWSAEQISDEVRQMKLASQAS